MNGKRTVFKANGQSDRFCRVCVLADIGGKIVKDPAQLLHIKGSGKSGAFGKIDAYCKFLLQFLLEFLDDLLHQQLSVIEIFQIPFASIQ